MRKRLIAAAVSAAALLTAAPLGAYASAEETERMIDAADESAVLLEETEAVTAEEAAELPAVRDYNYTTTTLSLTSVKVSFKAVKDAVGYDLYYLRDKIVVGTGEQAEEGSKVTIVAEELPPAALVQVQIRAHYADGSIEVLQKANMHTKSMKKPADLTVYDRTSSMTEKCSASLKWSQSPGVTGYRIYNSADDSLLLTVKGEDVCSAKLSGLIAGSDLKVYVRAYTTVRGKDYYSLSSARAMINCRPQTPAMKAEAGDQSITLSWNECKGAEGYMVYLATNGGYYQRVSIRKGADNTGYTIKGLDAEASYSVKIRAYRNIPNSEDKSYSNYSQVKTCVPYELKALTADANIYAQAGFSEKALGFAAKGKKVRVLGTSDRWVKVEYGGVTGYVYNLALGAPANVTFSQLTLDTLYAYVDDILFTSGSTPYDIAMYVGSEMKYQVKNINGKSRDQMAYEMLKTRYGSCYYYSALCDLLLERAGYSEHIIVEGYVGTYYDPSFTHRWCLYKSSKGWRHLDCTHGYRFHDFTDAQLDKYYAPGTVYPYHWDKSKYPAAV